VAVLFAAPMLHSVASSSAGASRGLRPLVPQGSAAAGTSAPKTSKKDVSKEDAR